MMIEQLVFFIGVVLFILYIYVFIEIMKATRIKKEV